MNVFQTFEVDNRKVYVNFHASKCFIAWDTPRGKRFIFENLVREGFPWWDKNTESIRHMKCLKWLREFVPKAEKARRKAEHAYHEWDTWRQSVTDDTRVWVGKTCPEVYQLDMWRK